MAQCVVYRNLDPASKAATPYLLDVQSDLMSRLATTVVVPLRPVSRISGSLMGGLTPVLEVEGVPCAMVTPQLAGISRKHLGKPMGDFSVQRAVIMAALDLLITGI